MVTPNKKVIFVSMSNRDSAMWFSFTGLAHAFEEYDVSFAFPSSNPAAETEYTEHLFYYNLQSPIKTARSVLALARVINEEYDRVVIFSQGIFSAYLTMLLDRRIEVIAWGHELINHVDRAGFFRGMNYYLSDRLMALRTSRMIVASDDLEFIATAYYPNKRITKTCLPMSGDFSCLVSKGDSVGKHSNSKIEILFFGAITSYKGLDILGRILEKFSDDDIHLTIMGRGPLDKYSEHLHKRAEQGRNVTWINKFVDAKEVVAQLHISDFMYSMYSSVTATSQIDIANAFGVPVLATELPFFNKKIRHGINGYILNEHSFYELLSERLSGGLKISREEIIEHYNQAGINKHCVENIIRDGIV
ncbi:glycosyltransferase [Aeromonas salmonicida]